MKKVKKETKLLVLKDSIRFHLESGESILLTHLTQRDTCYKLITAQLANV